jgi:tetratricopeptide (TPR) repeat protein
MGFVVMVLAAAGCVSQAGDAKQVVRSDVGYQTKRAAGFTEYMEGVVMLRRGKFEEAAAAFEEAAEGMPDSPKLFRDMVRLYLRLDEVEKARKACERAAELDADDAELHVMLGLLYNREEKFEEAAESFQKAIELEPDSPELYRRVIQAEERSNDWVAAIEMGERLIEMIPDSPALPALYMQLGWNLFRAGDAEAAREATEKAVEADSTIDGAYLLLGVIDLEMNDAEAAKEHLSQYIERVPDSVEGQTNYAAALARLGEFGEAAEALRPFAEEDSPNPAHVLQYQYLLLRAGNTEAASDIVPPNGAPIFGTFMRALLRKTVGEEYQPVLETLDEIESNIDVESQVFLISTIVSFGAEDTATYFASAMESMLDEGIRSRYLETLYARALMANEQNSLATGVLQRALETHGSDKWLHYYLAMIYEEDDAFDEAEHHLRECLREDPQDPDVMNFLGYMYAEWDRKLGEAEKLLNQALAMDPDNGYYLDSLGWIYYQQGDADKAIELIRRALLVMGQDDAVLRDHLGDAYLLQGNVKRAIAEWQRAVRLDPDLESAAEKIRKHSE